MEALREFLKGWKGKALLVIFLLPLAISGFESIVRQGDNPNAIAKVGRQDITNEQLQNAVSATRDELLTQVKGDASLINDTALRQQMLNNLIDRHLIINQSQQLGFTVSDATITQMLATHPNFQGKDGKFSNELFAEFLKSRRMTKEQLFDIMRQDLVVPAFSRGIVNTGLYPMAGINQFLSLQNETRPLWLARIPYQPYLSQVSVSDAEISQYFNQHKADLKQPEAVDLTYISLDKNKLSVPAPSEADIQKQYQTFIKSSANQPEYELAMILMNGDNAQATLNTVKQQLDKSPEKFAELAKQYSQDDGSKNDGGNIGTISPSMFPQDYDAIMAAVKALKVGQVTAPIKTQYGYQLFKLNKVNGATPPSLDSVRTTLVEQLNVQHREAAYQQLIDKINKDAVAGMTIGELANRYRLPVQTLKNYPKRNNQTALNQSAVVTAAFDAQTLQNKGVSVGIPLATQMVWVQPSNYRNEAPLTQAQAVPIIKEKLTIEKAKALALTQAKALANNVMQANSVENAPIKFQSLGAVTRQHPALLPEEQGAAFNTPATAGRLAVTTQATEQGASVLVGGAITQGNTTTLSAADKQQAAKMIRDNIGQSQFDDYLAYLKATTPIKIKETPTDTVQ